MTTEDDDKEMRKFVVSIFRKTEDVGELTVKFLRNKFLEKLGKTSLEPDRKERFKEIVHNVFYNFSPMKQDSACKSTSASTLEEVSSDKEEDEEDSSESQDESEDNNSDASEDHSPQKKKQRLEIIDDESGSEEEEGDNCIERPENSENCSQSQTLSENKLNSKKSMQNEKVRKHFKEKTINEEIAEGSSDEKSSNGKKFDTGRVGNSSQSNSSGEEKTINEEIKRKSIENIHNRKRQAKKNKNILGNSNSSVGETAKENLVNNSNHQDPEEDSDFKLNLDKCSQSDNTDVSEKNEDGNEDLSCEVVANECQDSDHDGSFSSKEDKENKMVKNTGKSTKKRQRTKSSENQRKPSSEGGESAKLRNLKKYLRTCGLHIKKYASLFEGCHSMAAKERKLESYIRDNMEIEGRITLEKCKKARQVKEEAKELAELDTTNIIKDDTGRRRPRRTCQLWCSGSKPVREPASPNGDKKIFSRLKGIVDSDSESDDEDKETINGVDDERSWKETAVDAKRQRIILSESDSDD